MSIFPYTPEDEEYNVIEHQLFNKGVEITEVVRKIVEIAPDDLDERAIDSSRYMMEHAYVLSVKVAGASGDMLYDIKMTNAAIIRQAAHNLIIQEHGLRRFGFEENDYFLLVRELVEEYRHLFIQWVKTFDPWNYIIDRWGLFNPPGIDAYDHDPDDDLPFNPDELE